MSLEIIAIWWLRQSRISLQCRRSKFDPWVGKIPWRKQRQPTPIFLPGEFHGQKSLADYSPWGCKESDMTERLTFSFSLSIQYWVYISIWSSLLCRPLNSLLKLSSYNSCPCLVEFLRIFIFEVQLIYSVVLISPVWQGDSVIHIQSLINILMKKYIFSIRIY